MEEPQPRRLIAKNSSPITTYLMTPDGLKSETFNPMDAAIPLICRAVKHDRVQKSLANSFNEVGLIDPIIVMPNTYPNWWASQRGVKNHQAWLKSYPLLAYTGNQRLRIARKLGYDTITCIIAENVEWAHAYQLILQDGVINNEIISE